MIITYKHGIYELPHELPNDLRLRKLGNIRKVSKRPEWQPSAQPPAKVKALPILAGNPWKPETKLPPLCPIPPGNQSQPQISREPLQAPMPQPLDQGRLIQYARKISRKTNISYPALCVSGSKKFSSPENFAHAPNKWPLNLLPNFFLKYYYLIFPGTKAAHRRCNVKKVFFKHFAKFTGKHLCQSLF